MSDVIKPRYTYLRSVRQTSVFAARPHSRRGSMIPIMAVSIIVLIVAAAFSVDTAYIQLSRTEMRNAVDAAARGAGRVLASGGSDWLARQTAKDVALLNRVAGSPLRLSDADIVQGAAQRQFNGVYSFTAGGWPSNAFQIVGRRTSGSLGGQINSIFGGMLGVSNYNAQQSATVVRGDRDVMLVLDVSGSMMLRLDVDMTYPSFRDGTTPPDPWLSRWGVLVQSLDTLLNTLNTTAPTEKVGLITFSDAGTYHLPLSTNYSNIYGSVNSISNAPLVGWTNMGEGMQSGRTQLIN
ncbi:MAG: VWA domain-containing protein, partial [Pirellulaceae bacterium]|nr:VWA domain-containing protein [Pirellulaceae bacterium]